MPVKIQFLMNDNLLLYVYAKCYFGNQKFVFAIGYDGFRIKMCASFFFFDKFHFDSIQKSHKCLNIHFCRPNMHFLYKLYTIRLPEWFICSCCFWFMLIIRKHNAWILVYYTGTVAIIVSCKWLSEKIPLFSLQAPNFRIHTR